mmetsp:Transcript_24971/g.34727  ORF Transcript_24971/g.34727 Transcript_24971/m.34727 type:complete len:229 (-) Transcript_24971:71-757(-)
MKMGWKSGTGCGRDEQGIKEPIALKTQEHGLGVGIGKGTEYDEQAKAATENRKLLLVEKKETKEEIKARVESAFKEAQKKEHVKEIQKVFLCPDCDKQYTNVTQYEEHCNSYDHHHRVRLKEMRRQHQARKMASRPKKKGGKSREEREFAARVARAQAMAQQQSESKAKSSGSKPAQAQDGKSVEAPKTEEGMQGKAKVSMNFGMAMKKKGGKKRKGIGFSIGFKKRR